MNGRKLYVRPPITAAGVFSNLPLSMIWRNSNTPTRPNVRSTDTMGPWSARIVLQAIVRMR